MILTRCPACGTTFRVLPEQLEARGGRVRCGHCRHAFHALENEVSDAQPPASPDVEAIEAPSEPVTEPTPALFVLEEKPSPVPDAADEAEALPDDTPADEDIPSSATAPTADTEAQTDDLIDAIDELLVDAPQDAAPEPLAPPADHATDDAELAAAAPDFEISVEDAPPPQEEPVVPPFADIDDVWPPDETAPHAESDSVSSATEDARDDAEAPPAEADDSMPTPPSGWPDAAELDLKSSPDEPVDFDALLHKQDQDQTPDEALAPPPDAQPWPASEEPAAMLAQPLAAPVIEIDQTDDDAPAPPVSSATETVETDETMEALASSADDAPLENEPEEAPASSAWRQAAWAAGATLLVLALIAQSLLVFRGEIVQSSPELRPFMESLCAGLGCELPLPRNAADIAIESSDIQPDASREAFFTLHATLRNRADFPQAYPYLEVTLTDARDKALVRKVLEPAQWLPSDAAKDAFRAHGELAVRVNFEAPGVAAAGYRVYAFYP